MYILVSAMSIRNDIIYLKLMMICIAQNSPSAMHIKLFDSSR